MPPTAGMSCGPKRTCGEMASCAEAVHYLRDCGRGRLDGDGDGIPCETLCGKDRQTMDRRLGAQQAQSLLPPSYACGAKRTCSEMDSCAEARFHLEKCGVRSLDRDGDGIPCEGLCR
ncbi:excalibur calcium-binding domain-containing protein [Methyloceanibacter methanicus]|nr:excalibur calcium-binding domain-containing protein [Methyloceanibacter methanicus]